MMRLRRFRKPFLPLRSPSPGERAVMAAERLIKGALFNCSMCGNCLLQETAFICPLLCPKGLRNGPCGSGTMDHCCVDPERPCVWHLIYEHAERLGRLERLLEVQAPLDWSRVGHETWLTVLGSARERGLLAPRWLADGDWRSQVDAFFQELRQPDWWQGDDRYHPPACPQPVSPLQATLQRGEFVVTAEIAPPNGAGASRFVRDAGPLRGLIHAANVTQNAMSTARMSSLACCLLLARQGIEPVLQLTARDHNRFALQSQALGAAALGIHNLLCLTGDPPTAGRGPAGGLPFDLDAAQMLWILRRLRDEALFLDGRKVNEPPQLFLGAAASPGGCNLRHEALRLEKKINAGAQYIQTQLIYSADRLERWLEALEQRNLLDRVHILAGIGPLPSARMAHYLQARIADIDVPADVVARMERSAAPQETGLEMALELIEAVRAMPGVAGIHIMTLGHESMLPRLVREVGLRHDTIA